MWLSIICVKGVSERWIAIAKLLGNAIQQAPFFCPQSIFSQLKLSPSLKKVLFATALGSVALALTAHQLKRRGRKRKQVTNRRESQKTVGMPEALLRKGRPSSLKRGIPRRLEDCCFVSVFEKTHSDKNIFSLFRSVQWPADDEPKHKEQWHNEWHLLHCSQQTLQFLTQSYICELLY